MCLQGGRGGGAHLLVLGEGKAVRPLNADPQISILHIELLELVLQISNAELVLLALAIRLPQDIPQLIGLAIVLALACCRR